MPRLENSQDQLSSGQYVHQTNFGPQSSSLPASMIVHDDGSNQPGCSHFGLINPNQAAQIIISDDKQVETGPAPDQIPQNNQDDDDPDAAEITLVVCSQCGCTLELTKSVVSDLIVGKHKILETLMREIVEERLDVKPV